jgi:hypothetical protein
VTPARRHSDKREDSVANRRATAPCEPRAAISLSSCCTWFAATSRNGSA